MCCHSCHSNETRAPVANPPNSAQLEGNAYHSSSYVRVRAVVWKCEEGQTDRHIDTQKAVANIHFALATPHAKCNCYVWPVLCSENVKLNSPCSHIYSIVTIDRLDLDWAIAPTLQHVPGAPCKTKCHENAEVHHDIHV